MSDTLQKGVNDAHAKGAIPRKDKERSFDGNQGIWRTRQG
jgi:hypothetical protein